MKLMSMRLWTDFNYMEDEDRFWADLDNAAYFSPDDVKLGTRATLFDGLGYECQGNITQIDSTNRMVELKPDWSTWRRVQTFP